MADAREVSGRKSAPVVTGRVLLADDNDAKRYLLRRWLVNAGFLVEEALTGAEAVRAARHRPDIVILDVRLPDMSGLEVCWKLKNEERTSRIPILHVSSHMADTADRVIGLDGGADAYLAYPVEPEELVATVRSLLRAYKAEAALRESEERFRLVGRATSDAVWDWDLRTNTVVWNAAAELLFRVPTSEMRGTSEWWYSRIHPDDRARVVAGLHAVIDGAGEYWCDEYRLLCGPDDGSGALADYVTVYDRGYVVRDDAEDPVRMVGSMLDVSERRRSEDARQFLGNASTLLAGSLDYVSTLKNVARLTVPHLADWCILYTVGTDRTIYPLEVAAHTPKQERELWERERRYPINPASSTDTVARVIREGKAEIVDGGSHYDDNDGVQASNAATSSMVVPLRGRAGMLGALLLTSTIPSRPFTRDQLRLAQELADRAALAVDNAKLYEAAVLASRSKSDFLGVMSHELRTPLNAILGYSDLLLLGIPGAIPDPSKEYLDRLRGCAKHLLQLIEQIFVFSRMESGTEPLVTEPIAVRKLVQEAVTVVEPLIREKGLRFKITDEIPDVEIRSDSAKVSQILLALFSNAIKFTHAGTVALTVRAEPDRVIFDVTDSGIGISTENIEKIFDPFWQVQQEKTRTIGGTGLGLTVALRLAQLLHGSLRVMSRPKQGSTFTLTLPYDVTSSVR